MGGDYPSVILGRNGTDRDPRNEEFDECANHILKEWTGQQAVGLFLYGPPGTGKTTAAVGLASKVLDKYNEGIQSAGSEPTSPIATVYSVTASSEVPLSLDGGRGPASLRMPAGVQTCMSAGKSVVVFDDYMGENNGEEKWQAAMLSKIVIEAERTGALVIVTTNLENPMDALDSPEPTPEMLAREESAKALERMNQGSMPEEDGESAIDKAILGARLSAEAKAAALRSRMGSMFRYIQFDGPDLRPSNSFWDNSTS